MLIILRNPFVHRVRSAHASTHLHAHRRGGIISTATFPLKQRVIICSWFVILFFSAPVAVGFLVHIVISTFGRQNSRPPALVHCWLIRIVSRRALQWLCNNSFAVQTKTHSTITRTRFFYDYSNFKRPRA